MLSAALDLQDKIAGSVMTVLDDIFMLDVDVELDRDLMKTIYESGYSRIPIYKKHRENIVGVLLVKDLILIKP